MIIRERKYIITSDACRTVQNPRHTTLNAYTMGHIAKAAGFTPDGFRKLH